MYQVFILHVMNDFHCFSVPFTTYDLQISSYNSKGEGKLSNVYPVMTDVAGMCFSCIYVFIRYCLPHMCSKTFYGVNYIAISLHIMCMYNIFMSMLITSHSQRFDAGFSPIDRRPYILPMTRTHFIINIVVVILH